MSEAEYYWCTRHNRVESGDDVCPIRFRLGPYQTPAEAERALEIAQQRTEAWDAEDARWHGNQR